MTNNPLSMDREFQIKIERVRRIWEVAEVVGMGVDEESAGEAAKIEAGENGGDYEWRIVDSRVESISVE